MVALSIITEDGEVRCTICSFICLYLCWNYKMVDLKLFYNSIIPSTYKDDVSASIICRLERFKLVNWCISRPT